MSNKSGRNPANPAFGGSSYRPSTPAETAKQDRKKKPEKKKRGLIDFLFNKSRNMGLKKKKD